MTATDRPVGEALPDPLHDDRPNSVRWSRANMAEAMPGVLTPLGWSFWAKVIDESSRQIFHDIGVITRRERDRPPTRIEDQFAAAFWGRAAVNVDRLRWIVERVPGGDPDGLERQILGKTMPGSVAARSRQRYPAVALKAPVAVGALRRRLHHERAVTDRWWRTVTRRQPPTAAEAAHDLARAYDRFLAVQVRHGFCVLVGQAAYDRLAKVAESAGRPDLELDLAISGRPTEETVMIADLWAAARGELTLDEVRDRHGFHGPDEGELSAHSWREDPAPLESLVDSYRRRGARPREEPIARRRAAELAVLGALDRRSRVEARLVLRAADTFLPLREVGKTAFLQALDAARAAARHLGGLLADAGAVDDPEDVFFLTVEEATRPPFAIDRDLIAHRRERHEAYREVTLPDSFVGVPEPIPATPDDGGGTAAKAVVGSAVAEPVTGVGASPGVVEGRGRVVADPGEVARLEDGDVLVCHTTDPGWVPLFEMACAVVIDIGGPLSHGAIVARELGIPCVIGTGDGTSRIADGAAIRVDGSAGTVTFL